MATERKMDETGRQNWQQIIRSSAPSFEDLADVIFFEILMRLPTKSIIFCKCTCKRWYDMISDPEFARFYSKQVKPKFLVRTVDSNWVSRRLFLVEPEQHSRGFDLDDCLSKCTENHSHDTLKKKKKKHNRDCHMKLNSVMKIPLNNADRLFPGDGQSDTEINAKAQRTCPRLRPVDHKFMVANSCNGLLCLSEPLRNDPVAVCNPLTGEYIKLPKTRNNADDTSFIDCGLGFGPNSNAYKVIRVFTVPRPVDEIMNSLVNDGEFAMCEHTLAEVHTLGTDSWRSLAKAPHSMFKLAFPTYLNGALYCFCINLKNSDCIISFNVDDEKFEPVPLPPACPFSRTRMTMGVMRGDLLCACDDWEFEAFHIWTMKNCDGTKSWTKLFSVREGLYDWPFGAYQPISYFENGDLLMFHNYTRGLIHYDREGFKHNYIRLNDLESRYEAIAYTPSFVPLKNIIAAHNVEVLNVNSRCGSLKLPGEMKTLYLDGQLTGTDDFSGETCDEHAYWEKHNWLKE